MVSHAALSTVKPWRWSHAMRVLPRFCNERMPDRALSSKVEFDMIKSPALFELHMFLRYSLPSSLLNAISVVGTKKQKRMAAQFDHLVGKVRMLVDAFIFFVTHEWLFDASVNMSMVNNIPDSERFVNSHPCVFEIVDHQWNRFVLQKSVLARCLQYGPNPISV